MNHAKWKGVEGDPLKPATMKIYLIEEQLQPSSWTMNHSPHLMVISKVDFTTQLYRVSAQNHTRCGSCGDYTNTQLYLPNDLQTDGMELGKESTIPGSKRRHGWE